MLRPLASLAAILLVSMPATGQSDEQAVPRLQDPSAPVSDAAVKELPESTIPDARDPRFRALFEEIVPIHTAPDDPEGGAYGIWAAGSDYKVSFHDGFDFVPYLGPNYPQTQSFAWRTDSVTVQGEDIFSLGSPIGHERADGLRYEYRFAEGRFVEAYDIQARGVEQTFVLADKPQRSGDLVIRGQVMTALRSAARDAVHGGMIFSDVHGTPILSFGAAFGIDANGEKIQLATSFDGRDISIHVPGSWMADAAYPVTIDPLLSRECVSFWTSANPPPSVGGVLDVDIGRDDIANQLMVAYTRAASASDTDMWVFLFDSDDGTFSSRNQVFTDITTSWGNFSPAIAFAGGAADSWIVAFTREGVGGGGTQNGVRYHLHDTGDLTSNSSFTSVSRPGGASHGRVDVGGVMGNSSGSSVFLVYERTDSGSNSDVFGKPINLSSNTQGTEVLLDTGAVGTDRTRLRPSINQVAQSGTDGWVVAWQEYWNARNAGGNDDWDINLRRITGAGAVVGLVRAPTNSTNDTIHKLTPIVSGANNRYSLAMATWAQGTQTPTTTSIGTDIFNETFTWTVSDTFAFGEICELTLGLVSDRRWRVTDGTHDTNTDSHWCWMFESTLSGSQYACTTGWDSGRIERVVAYNPTSTPNAFSGSVTFNDDRNEFVTAYGTNEGGAPCGTSRSTNHTVYIQRMTHLPEPTETRYGTACGPGVIGWSGRNLAGIRSYSVTLASAPASAPAALFLSTASDNLPLDIFGFAGCFLNVDAVQLFAQVPATTGPGGTARATFSLDTCPTLVCGDVFFQWAYLTPRVIPASIGATRGLQVTFTCP